MSMGIYREVVTFRVGVGYNTEVIERLVDGLKEKGIASAVVRDEEQLFGCSVITKSGEFRDESGINHIKYYLSCENPKRVL